MNVEGIVTAGEKYLLEMEEYDIEGQNKGLIAHVNSLSICCSTGGEIQGCSQKQSF